MGRRNKKKKSGNTSGRGGGGSSDKDEPVVGRPEKPDAPDESLIPGLLDDVALNCMARAGLSDQSALSCVNRRLRAVVGSGAVHEVRRKGGWAVENWVFLFCDHERGWVVFDTRRGRWMALPPTPSDDCFNHADKESLAVGCELLVLGREMADVAVWKYSLAGNRWLRAPPMNFRRCLFGSASMGSVGIFAGGSDMDGNVLRSAELYDSVKGEWELLPDMTSPRRLSSGFFMDDKFVVIGGMSSGTTSLECGEEFDLVTRRWRRIEGMYPMVNRAAQAPPLVAVVDNRLYTVDRSTNEVMRYEKAENAWTVMGVLPVRADATNGWGLAFKACCREVMVVAGERNPQGEVMVLSSWSPRVPLMADGSLHWRVVGRKENVGVFVYNCAVMGC